MSNLESNPDFVSQNKAAEIYSVSPRTISNWIKSGKLPAYEAGPKLIRISVLDLRAFCKPAHLSKFGPLTDDRSALTASARKTKADQARLSALEINAGNIEGGNNDLA